MRERSMPHLDYEGAASASRIGPLPAGFAAPGSGMMHDPSGTRYEFGDLDAPVATLTDAWSEGEVVGLTIFLPLGAAEAAQAARTYAGRLGMAHPVVTYDEVAHPEAGTLVTLREP